MEKPDAKNNTAENRDELVEKLLNSIGDDPELREKLLAALAKAGDRPRDAEKPTESEESAAETAEEEDEGTEESETDDGEESSGESLADLCDDDGAIGLLVGFAAGAALVGGGVLLHKLLSRN